MFFFDLSVDKLPKPRKHKRLITNHNGTCDDGKRAYDPTSIIYPRFDVVRLSFLIGSISTWTIVFPYIVTNYYMFVHQTVLQVHRFNVGNSLLWIREHSVLIHVWTLAHLSWVHQFINDPVILQMQVKLHQQVILCGGHNWFGLMDRFITLSYIIILCFPHQMWNVHRKKTWLF